MIKKRISVIFLTLLFVCAISAQTHSKFGYRDAGWLYCSAKIPATLVVEECPPMPTFGGDAVFLSKDKKVRVTFFTNIKEDCSPKTRYNEDIASYPNITLKVFKKEYYVLSGFDGNEIYYRVTKWNNLYVCTVTLRYPKSLKQYYDSACAALLKSFSIVQN